MKWMTKTESQRLSSGDRFTMTHVDLYTHPQTQNLKIYEVFKELKKWLRG